MYLWFDQFSIKLVGRVGQDLVHTPGVTEGDESKAPENIDFLTYLSLTLSSDGSP